MRIFWAVSVIGASHIAATAAVVPRCKMGGPAGLDVSCIALGTLHLNEVGTPEAALAIIQNALSLGITTFDLSDVYGMMPQLFGSAIQLSPGLREQIQVVAKMDILFPSWAGRFGFDASSYYDMGAAHLNAGVYEGFLQQSLDLRRIRALCPSSPRRVPRRVEHDLR